MRFRRILPALAIIVLAWFTRSWGQATPRIFSVSPGFAVSQNPQITITVTGEYFHSNAQVQWNGNALSTTFVNSGQVTATVPTQNLTFAGAVQINVANPGAATSPAARFRIYDSPPLYSWSPTVFTAGQTTAVLVYGDHFLPGSEVIFDGGCFGSTSTEYVSPTKLSATIPGSCISGDPSSHVITVSFNKAVVSVTPDPNTTTPITETVSPPAINFGNQTVNTSSASAHTITVSGGQTPLRVSAISITGTNASEFSWTDSSSCNVGGQIAVGQTCDVQVTFTPTAASSASATLNIFSNASTQTVALSGTGVSAGSPPPSSPGVQLNPTGLAFGSVVVGNTSGTLTSTLTNTGTATLNFSSIAVTGTNAADFTLGSGTCNPTGTLAASSTCTIKVTFTPSAAQAESAAVTITDNASGSPESLPLTGNGVTSSTSTGKCAVSNPQSLLCGQTAGNFAIPPGWTSVCVEGFEGGTTHCASALSGTVSTAFAFSGSYSLNKDLTGDGQVLADFIQESAFGTYASLYVSFRDWEDSNAVIPSELNLAVISNCSQGTCPSAYLDLNLDWDAGCQNASGATTSDTVGFISEQLGAGLPGDVLYCPFPKIPVNAGSWRQWEYWWHPNTISGGVPNNDGFIKIYKDGQLYASKSGFAPNGAFASGSGGISPSMQNPNSSAFFEIGGVVTAFCDPAETTRNTHFGSGGPCPSILPTSAWHRAIDDILVMKQ